jgi:hypothetical protein
MEFSLRPSPTLIQYRCEPDGKYKLLPNSLGEPWDDWHINQYITGLLGEEEFGRRMAFIGKAFGDISEEAARFPEEFKSKFNAPTEVQTSKWFSTEQMITTDLKADDDGNYIGLINALRWVFSRPIYQQFTNFYQTKSKHKNYNHTRNFWETYRAANHGDNTSAFYNFRWRSYNCVTSYQSGFCANNRYLNSTRQASMGIDEHCPKDLKPRQQTHASKPQHNYQLSPNRLPQSEIHRWRRVLRSVLVSTNHRRCLFHVNRKWNGSLSLIFSSDCVLPTASRSK